VPRIATASGLEIPPRTTIAQFVVVDDTDFRGPRKTIDIIGRKNPIITDTTGAPDTFLPPQKLGQYKYSNLPNTTYSHYWRNYIEMTNQGFVDGHVEKVKADDMKPRYGYGNGNYIWR
jgi:prepilin-type processing-associated H-X9-DG protein